LQSSLVLLPSSNTSPYLLLLVAHPVGRAAFVESAKRQGVYSTKRHGARGMAEEARGHPEPHFCTREFKVEAVRLSESSDSLGLGPAARHAVATAGVRRVRA